MSLVDGSLVVTSLASMVMLMVKFLPLRFLHRSIAGFSTPFFEKYVQNEDSGLDVQ